MKTNINKYNNKLEDDSEKQFQFTMNHKQQEQGNHSKNYSELY